MNGKQLGVILLHPGPRAYINDPIPANRRSGCDAGGGLNVVFPLGRAVHGVQSPELIAADIDRAIFGERRGEERSR